MVSKESAVETGLPINPDKPPKKDLRRPRGRNWDGNYYRFKPGIQGNHVRDKIERVPSRASTGWTPIRKNNFQCHTCGKRYAEHERHGPDEKAGWSHYAVNDECVLVLRDGDQE